MDLDADGRLDVLSGSWPGELYLFRGQDDGAFAAAETLRNKAGEELNPGAASSPFAADWDADGDLDLLVGTISGTVSVVPNEGTPRAPQFGASERLDLGPLSSQIADAAPVAADWDADGRLDLLVATDNGSVHLFRNTGTAERPRLAGPVRLIDPSPSSARTDATRNDGKWGRRAKICVTDWNGDGRLDILLGDYCGRFTAKPSQTAQERAAERRSLERLPQLRKRWSAVFRDYRRRLQNQSAEIDGDPHELETLRKELQHLRDEIAKAQDTMKQFEPQPQSHGFVWLFLRKPSSSADDAN
ncbi:MAG: FG-GAP repeat domain-containing protein [Planctomycetaceae bacterium]